MGIHSVAVQRTPTYDLSDERPTCHLTLWLQLQLSLKYFKLLKAFDAKQQSNRSPKRLFLRGTKLLELFQWCWIHFWHQIIHVFKSYLCSPTPTDVATASQYACTKVLWERNGFGGVCTQCKNVFVELALLERVYKTLLNSQVELNWHFQFYRARIETLVIVIMSRVFFHDLKSWIIWVYFSENKTSYDQTKMTEL